MGQRRRQETQAQSVRTTSQSNRTQGSGGHVEEKAFTLNMLYLERLQLRTEVYYQEALEAARQLQQALDDQAELELTQAQARID